MTFAVTGANGFLGVHIIHHLLSKGYQVIGIIRPDSSLKEFDYIKHSYGLNENVYELLSWEFCELYDSNGLLEIFERVDYVFHVAGIISYKQKDFFKLLKINKEYTANVANMALESGVKKLIYCSSISALSKDKHTQMVSEDNSWDDTMPHSNYGLSKYLGECEIWRIQEEGLSTVIVNPGIILGYGNWNKGSNSLFKKAFNEFRFYSRGVTGFVGVSDVALAMCTLALSKISGERFVLVSENLSFQAVSNLMSNSFDKKPASIEVKGILYNIIYALVSIKEMFRIGGLLSKETVKASVSEHYFSNQKIIQQMDFEFSPLSDVIKNAVSWYKKSPPK